MDSGGRGEAPLGGSPDASAPESAPDGGQKASDALPEAPPGGTGGTVGGDPDAGGGGPSLCASGVLLCDGFEQDLDPALWTKREGGGGTVTVDTIHAYRGKKALHVHVAGGKGPAYISETRSFPVPNNVFYARMFIWFGDPIMRGDHFNLAEAKGTGNGASIRFGGQYRTLGVGTDGGASGDWTDKDSSPIPTEKWLCYEVLFKGDTSEFRVWVDGEERPKLHSGSNRHPSFKMPMFTSFAAGWWDYNGAEAQDLWIDEIAIDSKPIGCMK